MRSRVVAVVLLAVACGGGDAADDGTDGPAVPIGGDVQGDYALGPVAFHGSFANSCGPYLAADEAAAGPYLAGVSLLYNGDGHLCDACLRVTTRLGKSVVARIVTTGQTNHAGDIDLSPAAYDAIHEDDPEGTSDHPRPMTWRIVRCGDTAATDVLRYQLQTQANDDWTSLWVRRPPLPVVSVEVKSAHHPSFTAMTRNIDGTFNDTAGFGSGAFQLRVTLTDGSTTSTIEDAFPRFTPGGELVGTAIVP